MNSTNQTPANEVTPQQLANAQAVYDSFDFSDQQSCDYYYVAFTEQGMDPSAAFVKSVLCVTFDAYQGSK